MLLSRLCFLDETTGPRAGRGSGAGAVIDYTCHGSFPFFGFRLFTLQTDRTLFFPFVRTTMTALAIIEAHHDKIVMMITIHSASF